MYYVIRGGNGAAPCGAVTCGTHHRGGLRGLQEPHGRKGFIWTGQSGQPLGQQSTAWRTTKSANKFLTFVKTIDLDDLIDL